MFDATSRINGTKHSMKTSQPTDPFFSLILPAIVQLFTVIETAFFSIIFTSYLSHFYPPYQIDTIFACDFFNLILDFHTKFKSERNMGYEIYSFISCIQYSQLPTRYLTIQ